MYGDSETSSTNSTAIFASNAKLKREEVSKSREVLMDSDIEFPEYRQYQNNQSISGLLRFRSAPSSLLAEFTDEVVKNDNLSPGLTTRFSSSAGNCNLVSQSSQDLEDDKSLVTGYSLNFQLPPQYPRQSSATQVVSIDSSYGVLSSPAMDHQGQAGSNLMRQNSSPAGLFPYFTAQNGYAVMRGVGSYGMGSGTNGDLSPFSSRLKSQTKSSSGVPSSIGNFTGPKREVDNDGNLFAGSQNEEFGNHMPILSHHLSLPKTSAEMAVMEKLLLHQDSVPCKIRAKRGCATHPRSIAERVRRTRISERMRKLQEVVPNMDKQTNTADMLDLAVEYIKALQKQYKTLSDNKANCKCSSMQKPVSKQTV